MNKAEFNKIFCGGDQNPVVMQAAQAERRTMKPTVCKICGKQIFFIQLTTGKFIPVDTKLKRIRINEGNNKVITDDGRIIKGRFIGEGEEARGCGYINHFTTCKRMQNDETFSDWLVVAIILINR